MMAHHSSSQHNYNYLDVDNRYMTSDHVEKINWLREEIKKQSSMTDLGILTHSLGIEFIFHEHGITMT